jgi:GT2 family glycosyltransferase
MKVAVILLNYNSAADCKKCIGFLKRQESVEMEIVIVDNCSGDDDRLAVEELCQKKGCTFIANKVNKGYNAGNNVGLRYASEKGYEYALIANPDMEFPQVDYLNRLIEIMESDKNIAVCGSDIITPEGIHQSPMKRDGDWRNSMGWLTGLFKKKPKDTYDFIDHYEVSHYCHKVSGCCLLVRMNFIKEIDFFDEYPFLYCEEAILSKQVEQSGKWKMFYFADTYAVHRHISSEKGDSITRFRQWQRSRNYYTNNYSDDNWLGKKITTLSFMTYTTLMTIYFRIRKKFLRQ